MLKSKPVSLWIRSVARGKVISSASVLTFQMFSSGLNKHLAWLMKIVSEKGVMRMASDFFHCGKEKKKHPIPFTPDFFEVSKSQILFMSAFTSD